MNSTRLPLPGCIPEHGGISFVAPTGAAIAGAAQTGGESVWRVLWDVEASDPAAAGAFEYSEAGPASPDWETVELDGETVFVDESGTPWLARHLVPADAPKLSRANIALARRDYHAAAAARMAGETATDLAKGAAHVPVLDDSGPVQELVNKMEAVLKLAREQSRQLKAAWLRAKPAPAAEGGECETCASAVETRVAPCGECGHQDEAVETDHMGEEEFADFALKRAGELGDGGARG